MPISHVGLTPHYGPSVSSWHIFLLLEKTIRGWLLYVFFLALSLCHTSLKSKLAKNDFPEERTIYSESSRPGDFKNDLEIGLANNVAINMY